MWCFKRRGKYQASVVFGDSADLQECQDWKFVVYGRDDLLQTCNRHQKADAAHAITVLERKQYSLFIFCGEVVIPVIVINNERKGRGICEHICDGRSTCTNEAKVQIGGRTKNEAPPSSANLYELVPPAFAAPISPHDTAITIVHEETWSREIKYAEKGIIVEVEDRCPWQFADPEPGLLTS